MFHAQSDLILAIQATPVALATLRDELLPQYGPPMTAKGTKDKLAQVFRELEALGVATTDQLTPETIGRYVLRKSAGPPRCAPATVRGLLMNIRTICSYAEGRRYVAISPFRLKKLSRYVRVPPPTGKRHLSAEEIRRLLAVMRGDIETKRGFAQWRARRLYAATAIIAFTGLRKMEALCLWTQDIDLVNRVINLVPRRPHLADDDPNPARFKTEASAQPIAIPAALVPILEEWLAHRLDHPEGFPMPATERIPWLFPGTERISAWTQGGPGSRANDRLKAVGKRAGINAITWQMLRRSWATRAEALGIPQALITRQCRHTDAETTKRWYQQRDLDALKDAVEGFHF